MNKEFNFKILNKDLIQTSIKAINNTNIVKNITISNNNSVIAIEFGQSIVTYENKHNSNPNSHLDIRKTIKDGLQENRNALDGFKTTQQKKNAQLEEADNNLQSQIDKNKLGDGVQSFLVAKPVEDKHAVNKEYLSSTINNLPIITSNIITGLEHSVVDNMIVINKGFCLDKTFQKVIKLNSEIKKTLLPFHIGFNNGGLLGEVFTEDFVQPPFTSNSTLGAVSSSSVYPPNEPYKALDKQRTVANTLFLLSIASGWWKWTMPYRIVISQINFWNSPSVNRSQLVRIWADESKTTPLSNQFDAGGEFELTKINVNNVITDTIFIEHISSNGNQSGISELEIVAKLVPDKLYTHLISDGNNLIDVVISQSRVLTSLPDGFLYTRQIGEFSISDLKLPINPYPKNDLATAYINNLL